jgi:alpha-1,2-mannosyltransferase
LFQIFVVSMRKDAIVNRRPAVVALLVQQMLEPFDAGSHMGPFTNGGELAVYRDGGLQVLHGRQLYASTMTSGWFTYPTFRRDHVSSRLTLLNFSTAQRL